LTRFTRFALALASLKMRTISLRSAQVWLNVLSSTTALHHGLTTIRAAQTTAHAASFAVSVKDVAMVGIEVYSKGWLWGLTTVAAELVNLNRFTATGSTGSDEEYRAQAPRLR